MTRLLRWLWAYIVQPLARDPEDARDVAALEREWRDEQVRDVARAMARQSEHWREGDDDIRTNYRQGG